MKKRQQTGYSEAKRLYTNPKSRESLARNALVPRTTRSGKIFDNRRYSTLNHLQKLVMKEAPEIEEDAEESSNNAMARIETDGETITALESGDDEEKSELTDEEKEIDSNHEQFGEARVQSRKEASLDDGNSMHSASNEHDQQQSENDKPDEIFPEINQINENITDDDEPTTSSAAQGKVLKDKQLDGKKQPKKKNNKRRRRVKPIHEAHPTNTTSPPKTQQQNHVGKTVHWADEQENVELYQVKEFEEEKPRRRCTMFHKING